MSVAGTLSHMFPLVERLFVHSSVPLVCLRLAFMSTTVALNRANRSRKAQTTSFPVLLPTPAILVRLSLVDRAITTIVRDPFSVVEVILLVRTLATAFGKH